MQTKNIERELKSVKGDNSKLVKTLQETLELNEQLRAQVSILEETLCKQQTECDKAALKRYGCKISPIVLSQNVMNKMLGGK